MKAYKSQEEISEGKAEFHAAKFQKAKTYTESLRWLKRPTVLRPSEHSKSTYSQN